ncbi:MAG: peptide deformylase [Christensenellales bacterium]
MADRKVVMMGDELLRKKSKPVRVFDEYLWDLLDDMKETMHHKNGAGLAAVQVGILKRVVVVEANNMFIELVNPVIVKERGEDIEEEGCLSVGTVTGRVKRPMEVTVVAQDRYGYNFTLTGEKFLARVLCHEIDHLDGVLFVDKMLKETKAK